MIDIQKSVRDIAGINLKDKELHFVAIEKCVTDLCQKVREDALQSVLDLYIPHDLNQAVSLRNLYRTINRLKQAGKEK